MKKRLLSILLTACMVVTLLPCFTITAMAAGEGTGNPANGAFALNTSGVNMIYNADQLAYVAYQINNNIPDWRTASYKIMNNIDLSSYSNWEPIGIGGAAVNWPEFKGTFDGGGYTISNLRQVRDDGDFGLFGTISNWQAPGVVRNIALTNVVITATNINSNTAIGAIAGYNKGTIENCSVAGTISATSNNGDVWVGGITGRHWTTVRNCYSTANVLVAGNAGDCSGGIVGQTMGGEVTNCYFTGSVGLNLNSVKVGAIVGDNYGAASNCYWLSSSASVGVNQNVLLPGTASNISSFTGNTLASQVTIGGTSYSSLLGALNAWVNSVASTDLKTWTSSGSYPVFSTPWAPPTYSATVTVNKDGSVWSGSGKSLALYQSGTKKYDLTLNGSSAIASALAGTYDVYDGTTDTGVDIAVSGAAASADLNYYTVTFKNDDNTNTLNTQTVLSGQNAVYSGASPAKTSTAQYSYAFSKWVTTAGGSTGATLTNITAAKTVYASFTPTLRDYSITWKKDASTVIDTSTVAYGATPTHSNPEKTGYTFSDWTPAISSVTGAATYTATWTLDTYAINCTLNGGTATNPTSYQYTTGAFTLNNPTRAGYSFVGWSGTGLTGNANTTVTIAANSTGSKSYTANWKADKPASAPDASIVTAKTDKSLTITTQEGYEYSVNGTNWYSGTGSYTFTNLDSGKVYNLVCRKAAVSTGDISSASDASEALAVTTKNTAPAAPSLTFDRITANSVTISAVTGGEYSKDGGATWQDSNLFAGLSPGTKYNFAVRIKETVTTVASAASAIAAQYTAAETPATGVGYTIDYSAETISIASGYEVSSDSSFVSDKLLSNGAVITPGTIYYVRMKAVSGGAPASEAVSFTVSARPAAPTATVYSYDYKNEKIKFTSQYEVFTATSGGIAIASDTTAIEPGSTLYIRAKATASASASGWTTITIPARPAATGLSISAIRTDRTITVTAITGAEYSKDGGTTWQSSNEFTDLSPNTDYSITIRYGAAGTFASDALPSVTVRTKTSAAAAPSGPSGITQADHAITIDTIAGCQYAITTSDTEPTTWEAAETTAGTKTFSGLSAAAQYYIWVRAAETDTAMPSSSGRIGVYTAAAMPGTGVGYTIDYSAETISIANGYEVSTTDGFGTTLTNGAPITPGTTYYVRKAVDAGTTPNTPASEAIGLTLPLRPSTPAATATDETVAGKNDVRISGVTVAMEWKAASGAYAAVTADQESNGISGLSGGTYYVRYMAVSGTGFKSDEQEITIAAGHTITVTFNSLSGSAISAITGKAYGDKITDPAAPVRSGFYFAGWYKEAACTNPWTFTIDALTDDITLFAKWSAIPTYTVTGKIVDDSTSPLVVEGATVRMMQGATQFGTTGVTDIHGDFVINNIPPGKYNLVITKGTKTAIIKVEVSGDVAIGSAALPSGNANSVLVVSGSATPNVVVGGLNSEAGTQLAGSSNPLADNVEVKLTVEKKDATAATKGSEVTGAVTAAGKQVGMILEIDVHKKVNGTEDPSYNQTSGLIEINIPLPAEMQGKATYAIYRYHGAAVDTITETPNGDFERIVIDRTNWTITLYAKKFSTYAIGYTNPTSPRGGGGGGAASTAASPTAAAIESPKTVVLPYYVENGKAVFIGLAKDASGAMKYIAPEGVTVLFRENPKSFNDIAGHWAKGNIDFVTERELFLGTGDGNFSPQSGMTRAMFATVIGRLYERSYGKLSEKDDSKFADVDNDAYYETYINWASENNIITGIGGGLFKPDREITRQEMAAILYRFAEFLNTLPSDSEKTQLNYQDASEISSWATEAAVYCQQRGIITGRSGGNFVPQGTATRAEVAAILQRFIESSVK